MIDLLKNLLITLDKLNKNVHGTIIHHKELEEEKIELFELEHLKEEIEHSEQKIKHLLKEFDAINLRDIDAVIKILMLIYLELLQQETYYEDMREKTIVKMMQIYPTLQEEDK